METVDTQGIAIPRLGLGTFGMTGAEAQAAVENAASLGYRHFDTATMYDNEDAVGAGLAATTDAGLARPPRRRTAPPAQHRETRCSR